MQARQDQECDTLFYQGANTSQTQALRYTGDQKIVATTGEIMWAEGKNQLKPLKAIYHLHIGTEISDVNLKPYLSYVDYINPIKHMYSCISSVKNYLGGVNILPAINGSIESVRFHTPNLSEMSYGQTSDILSHHNKYKTWLKREDKKEGIILWGVSRGTAATFCAFAKYHYPEVKLVVLEGAIDSMENVIKSMAQNTFKSENIANSVVKCLDNTVAYLHEYGLFGYRRDDVSPIECVNNFPENIPVVFITSKMDNVVSPANTENIAVKLAERGKNDVYLFKLEKSSHQYYVYDDKDDRDAYEAFIHAIYRKYGLQHEKELADKGEMYLNASLISKNNRSELKLS